MKQNVFCPVPWTHASMINNGNFRVCCDINDRPWGLLRDGAGVHFNAKINQLAEIRNAPLLKELRISILKGVRHKMCGQCWLREDQGLDSRREMFQRMYPEMEKQAGLQTSVDGEISHQDFPIKNLDLRFGNKCNLSCRTCQPADSSLKMREWLRDSSSNSFSYYDQQYPVVTMVSEKKISGDPFEWEGSASIFSDLLNNAKNLHQLYITGGEPLINEEHWQILEQLVSRGYSADIHLVYNSNMNFLPRIAAQVWPHFKTVDIACSIDGVGTYAEYIRPPTVWEKVEQNLRALDEMPEHIRFSIAPTISVMNIMHLPDLAQWLKRSGFKKCAPEMGTHLLFHPEWYSVQVLSQTAKRKVREKLGEDFAGVLNHMDQEDKSHLLPRLVRELGDFRRQLPELVELILK